MQSKKGKPRGRPWPPGTSGNPSGRPRGSRHKTTLAVLEGIAEAVAELSKPLKLDLSKHYETWSDCYIQAGMRFRRDNRYRVNPKGPVPARPTKLDIREARQEVTWGRRRFWSQRGWLFAMDTHLPINEANNKQEAESAFFYGLVSHSTRLPG